jgi:N-acetylglucosaminyldiphosphoundecaprenol N-acetyl-beta-D-mannosaminyltransferase
MPFSTPAPISRRSAAFEVDDALATPPPTTDVLGVALALTDYERTMDWMDATVQTGGKGYICVAATHTVVATQDDPELAAAVRDASLVVPDGQPVVWAMNALGHDLPNRVYGPDLMAKYCERSALTGARLFLYGGRNQGTLVQLALNLRHRFDGVQIVGGHSPPFHALSDEELDDIVEEINRAKPDVVWVGIGVPKQEKWMRAMRERLDAPVLVGVGAAFDFHAGLVPQAPSWMQAAGLEWLFRLIQEPRRLWRRYLTYNPRFVAGFAAQYLRHRRELRRSAAR